MPELTKQKEKNQRPSPSAYWQQRMKSWDPVFTPFTVISFLVITGIIFLPIGVAMLGQANSLYFEKQQYRGTGTTAVNTCETPPCSVKFGPFEDEIGGDGDLYLYYELTNYHQNNIKYSSSVNWQQMMGGWDVPAAELTAACDPATTTQDLAFKYTKAPYVNLDPPIQNLNPCGLISSSFFTDTYTFNTANSRVNGVTPTGSLNLEKNNIATAIDPSLFVQPQSPDQDKFDYKAALNNNCGNTVANTYKDMTDTECTTAGMKEGCRCWNDGVKQTIFYYPIDSTTMYLYEQFPYNISPLDGVTDANFMNWMNIAALPTFRKLYGVLKGPFQQGDYLTVDINANGAPLYINNFKGTISVVLSAKGGLGVSNPGLGVTFIVSGTIMVVSALVFFIKQEVSPRPLGSPTVLNWQQR